MRIYKVKITVMSRGRGDFPIDMLRYDHCWPNRSQDAAQIAEGSWYGENTENPPTVELIGEWKGNKRSIGVISSYHHYPTVERWKSFGWDVVAVEVISG